MNARRFIDTHGLAMAERTIANVVFDAGFYSPKTGSYYSVNWPNTVAIKKLRGAVSEYKNLAEAKAAYETRLKEWQK